MDLDALTHSLLIEDFGHREGVPIPSKARDWQPGLLLAYRGYFSREVGYIFFKFFDSLAIRGYGFLRSMSRLWLSLILKRSAIAFRDCATGMSWS
jgi:hypothetical protein